MSRILIMILAAGLALAVAFPAQADRSAAKSDGATHVVSGKVKQVRSYFATNRWGDELILSDVTVQVSRTLKGDPQDEIVFTVEGGEVADAVLRVSTVPLFQEGEEVVLHLKRKDNRFEYLGSGNSENAAAKDKHTAKLACCKTFASWPASSVPFYVNPNTQDLSHECVIAEIQAAAGAWNTALGETLLQYAGQTDITAVSAGDQNAVFFRNDPSGSTIAVTYIWYTKKGGNITAFDMIFYDAWAYFGMLQGCATTCNGGFYLQPIAAHEFGHAIGLDHNRCGDSLMYPYASYCGQDMLSAYDTACVAGLYP